MNRQQISVVLAKFWDSFKQKNPETATVITAVGMLVLGVIAFSGELGINLPPIFNKLGLIVSLFLSFNNPSTYTILNPTSTTENDTLPENQ
jgi:multisubunit Na+/H+ antiporter MnhG subunit